MLNLKYCDAKIKFENDFDLSIDPKKNICCRINEGQTLLLLPVLQMKHLHAHKYISQAFVLTHTLFLLSQRTFKSDNILLIKQR